MMVGQGGQQDFAAAPRLINRAGPKAGHMQ